MSTPKQDYGLSTLQSGNKKIEKLFAIPFRVCYNNFTSCSDNTREEACFRRTKLENQPVSDVLTQESISDNLTAAGEEAAKEPLEEIIPKSQEGEEDKQELVLEPVKPYRKKGFRFGCYRFVKRSLDIFTSALFLIVFCWLYLLLAIIVKCSDGGKVVYRQERVGRYGKRIYLSKFRSMVKDSNDLEKYLTPEQIEELHRDYKVDNDPRITKLGRFLRKTSLDELPNIWAIFTGKISVVGPRPLVRHEIAEKYGDNADKLLAVKPGLIGWWAVNGRSNTTYEHGERQALELYYVDHCSLWLDTKIFFKAIGKVFKRDGAI